MQFQYVIIEFYHFRRLEKYCRKIVSGDSIVFFEFKVLLHFETHITDLLDIVI